MKPSEDAKRQIEAEAVNWQDEDKKELAVLKEQCKNMLKKIAEIDDRFALQAYIAKENIYKQLSTLQKQLFQTTETINSGYTNNDVIAIRDNLQQKVDELQAVHNIAANKLIELTPPHLRPTAAGSTTRRSSSLGGGDSPAAASAASSTPATSDPSPASSRSPTPTRARSAAVAGQMNYALLTDDDLRIKLQNAQDELKEKSAKAGALAMRQFEEVKTKSGTPTFANPLLRFAQAALSSRRPSTPEPVNNTSGDLQKLIKELQAELNIRLARQDDLAPGHHRPESVEKQKPTMENPEYYLLNNIRNLPPERVSAFEENLREQRKNLQKRMAKRYEDSHGTEHKNLQIYEAELLITAIRYTNLFTERINKVDMWTKEKLQAEKKLVEIAKDIMSKTGPPMLIINQEQRDNIEKYDRQIEKKLSELNECNRQSIGMRPHQ